MERGRVQNETPPKEREIIPEAFLKALRQLSHRFVSDGDNYLVSGEYCSFTLTSRDHQHLVLLIGAEVRPKGEKLLVQVRSEYGIDLLRVQQYGDTGVEMYHPSKDPDLRFRGQVLLSQLILSISSHRWERRMNTGKTVGYRATYALNAHFLVDKFFQPDDFYTLLYAQTVAASSTDS